MQGTVLRARRRVVLLVGAMVAALAGLGFVVPTAASAATGCAVEYRVENEWPGGFTAGVTVTNLGDPLDGWDLSWRFPSGQQVTQAWNAAVSAVDGQETRSSATNDRSHGPREDPSGVVITSHNQNRII